MEALDFTLVIAVVAVFSLTAITNLYVIHSLTRKLDALVAASSKAEDEEAEPEDEEEPSGTPSKEQILARRAQLVREIEDERGSRVIQLIHRKEPWSTADDEPEIVLEDSEVILQQVRETPPDKPIDFIVHTEGGLTFAADLMAMALRYHKAKVTAMVPFYAMSDGTYLALAADEIMMEKCSI